MADRFVNPAEGRKGEADVVVELGTACIQRDSSADQIDGGLVPAVLVGDSAEKMQALGVIGIAREHLPIEAFGMRQPAGLMMLDREREERPNVPEFAGATAPDPGMAVLACLAATRRALRFMQIYPEPNGDTRLRPNPGSLFISSI